MTRYASSTSVSSEQSRLDIERVLARYGADSFMYGWDASEAIVRFRMNERYIEFRLPMPDREDTEFTHHSRGRRTPDQATKAWEQATRQRWRALLLIVKAKLEAVESGIVSFDDEFLAHIMLPNGETVSSFLTPQVAAAYTNGVMPRGLLALPAAGETS